MLLIKAQTMWLDSSNHVQRRNRTSYYLQIIVCYKFKYLNLNDFFYRKARGANLPCNVDCEFTPHQRSNTVA